MDKAEELKEKGNSFFIKRNYSEALKYYSKAIELNNKNHIYFSNRAACYLSLNRFQEALIDCDQCLKLDQNWQKAYYRKALALEGLGRLEEALTNYEMGKKLDPKDITLRDKYEELQKKIIEMYKKSSIKDNKIKPEIKITGSKNPNLEKLSTVDKYVFLLKSIENGDTQSVSDCLSTFYCDNVLEKEEIVIHRAVLNKHFKVFRILAHYFLKRFKYTQAFRFCCACSDQSDLFNFLLQKNVKAIQGVPIAILSSNIKFLNYFAQKKMIYEDHFKYFARTESRDMLNFYIKIFKNFPKSGGDELYLIKNPQIRNSILNKVPVRQNFLLEGAAISGDLNLFKRFLEIDSDTMNEAFGKSVQYGMIDVLEYLVDTEEEIYFDEEDDTSPITWQYIFEKSCYHGNWALMKYCIDSKNIEFSEDSLLKAANNLNLEVCKFLVEEKGLNSFNEALYQTVQSVTGQTTTFNSFFEMFGNGLGMSTLGLKQNPFLADWDSSCFEYFISKGAYLSFDEHKTSYWACFRGNVGALLSCLYFGASIAYSSGKYSSVYLMNVCQEKNFKEGKTICMDYGKNKLWNTERHHLFPSEFKDITLCVLLCFKRISPAFPKILSPKILLILCNYKIKKRHKEEQNRVQQEYFENKRKRKNK